MDLQSIIKVNIDFFNKNHVIINAKQYDKQSRYVLFSCYNKNEFVRIDKAAYTAFVRYKKADDYGVFNLCTITDDGCILVELTEQMLAADGLCCADLIIAKGRSLTFDPNTGSIIGSATIPNILSTMTFYIDVSETPIENSEIESSYDYSGFNKALEAIKDDISDVITIAKSYAVGDAGGRRPNEDTDNAKYYYKQCFDLAEEVSDNTNSASDSETNAKAYMDSAKISEANAKAYRDNAYTYMENSENYMNSSRDYSVVSQRYAVGGTGIAENENVDNAKYYYEQCNNTAEIVNLSKENAYNNAVAAADSATDAHNYYLQTEAIVNGLNGAFLPMGTVTYEELATLKESETVGVGYLYNISNNFITDDTFKMGAGIEYDAGANVYYTADGYWDCLAGATVTGVKGVSETVYRKGNVELTAENVGAISSADIATVDEIKTFLDI